MSANPVTVFSATYCPYCDRAKELFDSLGTSYNCLELDKMGPQDGGQMVRGLSEVTGESTVPQIFICGQWIGGCNELKALHRQGKLRPMLMECCGGDITCSARS